MAERRRVRGVKDADDDPDQLAPDEAEDEELVAQEEAGPAGQGANGRQGVRQRPPLRRHPALTVKDAARAALRQIVDLTGKPAESITGVERTEDGWRVGIEVIEDRRIPSSADILATYLAEMDQNGDLVSYHRVRRYPRGRGDSNEGS
jgi:hypothetical protein